MRIAVMGAGGVGGYFGGVLARAGYEVIFIARGEHLEAIRKRGLRIRSHHFGEFEVKVAATGRPAEAGEVDLVLFTVKTYHNQQAIPEIRPMVGSQTAVLSLQNGVESYDQLGAVLGAEKILPGAAYIEASIQTPGVIRQRGEVVRILFGERTGQKSARCQEILETFTQAGIRAELSEDVMKGLWTKFVFIVALAGPTTTAREEMQELLKYEEGREVVRAVVKEAESVGRRLGIALDNDVFERTMTYIEGYARDLHASMHTDLERGRRLELETLNGAVVRLGRQAGVAVPVNHCIYALLKPHAHGREV